MSQGDRIYVANGWITFGSIAVIPVAEFQGAVVAPAGAQFELHVKVRGAELSAMVFRGTRQECRNRMWWLTRELRSQANA